MDPVRKNQLLRLKFDGLSDEDAAKIADENNVNWVEWALLHNWGLTTIKQFLHRTKRDEQTQGNLEQPDRPSDTEGGDPPAPAV